MNNLLEGSTVHGVQHIYRATHPITKYLWIILFICGIAGLVVSVSFSVQKYLTHPVSVSYTMHYESFVWPQLTFCNPEAACYFKPKTSDEDHWNRLKNNSHELFEIFNRTLPRILKRIMTKTNVDRERLNQYFLRNHFLYIGFIKESSGINDIKNSHLLDNRSLSSIFTTEVVRIVNNIPCLRFNPNQVFFTRNESIRSLVFFLKFDLDIFRFLISNSSSKSFYLFVTKENEIIHGRPIVLLPGHNNVLHFTQTRYKYIKLKRPCRNKLFEVELYDILLQKTILYEGNYEDCKNVVNQEHFVNECNCYNPLLPIYKNQTGFPSLCFNRSIFGDLNILKNLKCVADTYSKYEKNGFIHRKCHIFKLRKCDSITYKVEQQKEPFVEVCSKTLEDVWKSELNKENDGDFVMNAQSDILMLTIERQVEYGDLYMEEIAYPFYELLSNIGGLMGLWMGLSVVGLFEILEFLFLFIMKLCPKNKQVVEPVINKNNFYEI